MGTPWTIPVAVLPWAVANMPHAYLAFFGADNFSADFAAIAGAAAKLYMQWPPWHCWLPAQGWLQAPQCSTLIWMFAQIAPQRV